MSLAYPFPFSWYVAEIPAGRSIYPAMRVVNGGWQDPWPREWKMIHTGHPSTSLVSTYPQYSYNYNATNTTVTSSMALTPLDLPSSQPYMLGYEDSVRRIIFERVQQLAPQTVAVQGSWQMYMAAEQSHRSVQDFFATGKSVRT